MKAVRKDALFCLGNMDSNLSLSILSDIVYHETDKDMKEFGVFVISQIPHKAVYSLLKHISSTHPDSNVRKKALYWAEKTQKITAFNTSNNALD